MPLGNHSSFDRPPLSTRLWRYTDLPKFIDMLSSGTLWLTNAEVLAADDPYEGVPGAVQFPHRIWRSIENVPELFAKQIVEHYSRQGDGTPEGAFRLWFMLEEQRCIMNRSGRRDFYINCWHAAAHESVAMWKIYGSPGAGVAVITNGARLETALDANKEQFYLGAVRYQDHSNCMIGSSNAFDTIMIKRVSYAYESEVRLVHWHTGEFHDALENFSWNEKLMRFEDLVEDKRPIQPGKSFVCDLSVMIERVIISPFAPSWYASMICRLCERFGYKFKVDTSKLLNSPPVIP